MYIEIYIISIAFTVHRLPYSKQVIDTIWSQNSIFLDKLNCFIRAREMISSILHWARVLKKVVLHVYTHAAYALVLSSCIPFCTIDNVDLPVFFKIHK